MYLILQISIYANEKFKVAQFLSENTEAFKQYFILSRSDQLIDTLYKLKDVYAQIYHIVESVSYFCVYTHMHICPHTVYGTHCIQLYCYCNYPNDSQN